MALGTDKKLGIAVVVLVVLGGAFWLQKKKEKEEAQTYTAEKVSEELPKLGVTEDKTKAIDKIVIHQAGQDGGAPKDVTLAKEGDKWMVEKPVKAEANQTNVKSLLDNLKTLEVKESIDPSKDAYAKYELTDDTALHATFQAGKDTVADLYFGESGSRGQMTRIAGHDGVYSVKGYSSFLYARDVKDWRDRTVFKFDDKKVKAITITNEHGEYLFAKDGDKWTAKFKKAKTPMATALKDFEESKVKDAINAYKGLNADGFGEGKSLSDVGLETPGATITFELSDGAKKTLAFGASAEGTSRWAKTGESDEILSIGSWAADWAFAEPKKFTKADDSEKKKPPSMGGRPGGMQLGGMPGGMPGGHP